jgi:hypothetical protein
MGQDSPEFAWAVEMPLLTNRFFLYDGLKMFLWVAAIISLMIPVVFAVTGSLKHVMQLLTMFAWILAGLFYLFVLITWIVFRNRYPIGFRVDSQGVRWVSLSRRARLANRAAVIVGAATGSLTGAGAGLLAMSQESGQLAWDKLRKVKKYPEERVVTLMNSWRVVIRLYCTPENYEYVVQLVDSFSTVSRTCPATPVQ